ncbi:MAG: hypothetical protein Q9169_006132 [Polycauliona sp. 2 TL-2023]
MARKTTWRIGAELTFEVIEAASVLREKAPKLRVRVINVTDLMVLGLQGSHPHALSHDDFDALLSADNPVHFNHDGYSNELKDLLFGRPNHHRTTIEAYDEEGSTTTPLDVMLRNRIPRWHVVDAALKGAAVGNEKVRVDMHEMRPNNLHELKKVSDYIMKTGKDPDDAYGTPNFESGRSTHRDVGYAD